MRVEVPQERFTALALEVGTDAFVRPKDMSIFTAP